MTTTKMEREVATIDQPTSPAAITPMHMIEKAVASGNMDAVTKLMDLQERWEKNQARKSFDAAIAAAKSEMPIIVKTRQVDFTTPKGRTNYKFEDFASIARLVDPVLSKHGLSYRFRTQSNLNEPVVVTCILSHRDGHAEETTLSAGRDDTGNKNGIQAIGSTVSYLQRYTLKAALGLASSQDDDARSVSPTSGSALVRVAQSGQINDPYPSAGTAPPILEAEETLTEQQADELKRMIVERGANISRFIKWVRLAAPNVEKVEDIPRIYFDSCRDEIKRIAK